jgi:hypothetical protein
MLKPHQADAVGSDDARVFPRVETLQRMAASRSHADREPNGRARPIPARWLACSPIGSLSPILLKNSDLDEPRNFACPLNRIAHHPHEGIAADAENLVQEPRSAFAPASGEIAPLQIQIAEIQAPSRKRVFLQYPPNSARSAK